jgi:hypothetical protein
VRRRAWIRVGRHAKRRSSSPKRAARFFPSPLENGQKACKPRFPVRVHGKLAVLCRHAGLHLLQVRHELLARPGREHLRAVIRDLGGDRLFLVVAAFIAVEKIPGRKRGHPKHAVFYLAGTPRSAAEVDHAAANASPISTITPWSVSADSAFSNAATAEADPTRPSAQAECERTSGSESHSPDFNDGTATSSPQLPSATATFRRNPARPARRSGEPRENASHPDSSMDIRSTSDGAAVPGCHPSEGNGSTPTGGSPGPRAANAGADDGSENLRLKGQTSWEECRLPRYVIRLPRGKRK